MALATFIMAVATLWMASETRGLKLAEINSQLSYYDYGIEIVDQTGTPVKHKTGLEGELINKSAITTGIERAVLSLKLINNGKKSAIVKFDDLTVTNGLKEATIDISNLKDSIIPGATVSSWMYGGDIKEFVHDSKAYFNYNFSFKNIDASDNQKSESFKFTLECDFRMGKFETFDLNCAPIKYIK